jgi:hypothetical protein
LAQPGHTHQVTWSGIQPADNTPPYHNVIIAQRNSVGLSASTRIEFAGAGDSSSAGVVKQKEEQKEEKTGGGFSFSTPFGVLALILIVAAFAFSAFFAVGSRRERNERKRKAQLLSVDFLVAVALITVCVGVLLQFNEASLNHAGSSAFLSDNKAESIAALLQDGKTVPVNAVYCVRYALPDGVIQQPSGGCGDLSSCGGRGVFVARRFTRCEPSPTALPSVPSPSPVACLMEVKTC